MKPMYKILSIMLAAGILLSACTLPASTPPAMTPTNTGGLPFPVGTESAVMKEIIAGTATALALAGTTFPATAVPATAVAGATLVVPTSIPAAATATVPPVVIPTVSVPSSYTLQKDEFPYCIARRFNVDIGALLSANGLGPSSTTYAGLTLTIPTGTTWSSGTRALKSHPTSITVGSGATIYSIACQFGDVDPAGIIAANRLSSPYTLTAGQTLQIP